MNRHPRTAPRIPLTPAERHRRSRETLMARVMALTIAGHGLSAVARRKPMPRLGTLQRWLSQDAAFRARYEAARLMQAHAMADDAVALADRAAASARGRKRNAAIKLQIETRKWRLKTFAADERSGGRRGAKQSDRTDAHIAALDAALAAAQETARQQTQRDAGAPAQNSMAEDENGRPDETAATGTAAFGSSGSGSPWIGDDEGTESPSDDSGPDDTPIAAKEPPPAPFVPRWFDDDTKKPDRPYDPLKW